jgi:hypothetical protein
LIEGVRWIGLLGVMVVVMFVFVWKLCLCDDVLSVFVMCVMVVSLIDF